jgi:hypothetical protein
MGGLAEYLESYQSAFSDGSHGDDVRHCILWATQNPNDPMPLYRLALFAQMRGRWDYWKRAVMLAMNMEHDTPQATFHRACHHQRLGYWSAFRDKTAVRHLMEVDAGRLLWVAHQYDGTTDLSDKTVLLVHTGGFGDSLQLMCFVRPLARRAARVIVGVPPELFELATYNLGDCAEIVAVGTEPQYESVYRFDAYIYGWSIVDLFEAVPTFEPLHAPRPLSWSTFDRASLHVGIGWAASDEAGSIPSERSIKDMALLEPLFSLEEVSWHSLQVGLSASQTHPRLRRPDPPLATFADSANLIASLDAVVTVDTALCHLAGRLGVPTFTLLQHVADERWGFGDTTAWYPSMRLIRERRMGDWSEAIGTLAHHLSVLRDEARRQLAQPHR